MSSRFTYDSIETLLEQVEKPALYRKRLNEGGLCAVLWECDFDVPDERKEVWYQTQPEFHKAEVNRILYNNLSTRLGNTTTDPAVMLKQHEAFLAYGEDYLYKDFFLDYDLIRNLVAVIAFKYRYDSANYLTFINMLQNIYHLSDEEIANFNVASTVHNMCKWFYISLTKPNDIESYGFDILEEQIEKKLDDERKNLRTKNLEEKFQFVKEILDEIGTIKAYRRHDLDNQSLRGQCEVFDRLLDYRDAVLVTKMYDHVPLLTIEHILDKCGYDDMYFHYDSEKWSSVYDYIAYRKQIKEELKSIIEKVLSDKKNISYTPKIGHYYQRRRLGKLILTNLTAVKTMVAFTAITYLDNLDKLEDSIQRIYDSCTSSDKSRPYVSDLEKIFQNLGWMDLFEGLEFDHKNQRLLIKK